MSKWPTVPLGQVASFDRQIHDGSAAPYVGMEDIEAHSGRYLGNLQPTAVKSHTFAFDSSHVLYGRLRPYLNKWLVPTFSGHCSTEVFPIRPSAELLREYLAYWLSSERTCSMIDATSRGARMPRANMDEVLSFLIPLPPLEEQKRIVARLDRVFAEVDIAESVAGTQADEQAALLRAARHDAFNLVDAPRCRLGDVLEAVIDHRGKTPTKLGGSFTDNGVRVISAIHVKDGKIHWERRDRFVSEEMYQRWMPVPLRRGDVLLTSEAPLGQVARVPDDQPLVLSQRLFALRGAKNLVRNDFLFHFLRSPQGQLALTSRQTGATAVGIKQSELLKVLMPVPPPQVQDRICVSLDGVDEKLESLRDLSGRRLKLLSHLRASALKSLVFES